ncbi:MAG: hypothetical protein K2P33_12340, partial [Acutalibacter sp.]|nr:hypothetical protein [Acutalibacter sp.]
MKRYCHKHSYDHREDIRYRLRVHDTLKSPNTGKNQDHWHKANSLPARAENKTFPAFSHGEEQGGIYCVKPEQHDREPICPQRSCTYAD